MNRPLQAATPDTTSTGPGTSWDVALRDFSDWMRGRGRRQSTVKGYRCHLATLAALHPAGPAAVTADHVTAWLIDRGPSRRAAWAAARVFFAFAARSGYVAVSPVPESGRPSPGRQPQDAGEHLPVAWLEPVTMWQTRLRAAGRAPRTIDTVSTYVRAVARVHPDPWRVTGQDLAVWLAGHDTWAPETRRSALNALRGFYRASVAAGLVDASPAESLESVRVPRGLPRPVAHDALLAALEGSTDRDKLLVLLAAYAGLRCREIASVRPSTDLQDGFLYVVGKGGHERRVPVHPVVGQAIDDELRRRASGSTGTGFRWVGEVRADGYLFPGAAGGHITPGSVSRRLGQILPGRWTAHTLRHRFASAAYASTRDLRAVQELLGHASPVTTARYTATPDDALRAAVLGIAG